jgi:hypothetical protein
MQQRLVEGAEREQQRLMTSNDPDAVAWRKDLDVEGREQRRREMEDARWRLRSQFDDLMMEDQAANRHVSATFASINQALTSMDRKLSSATRDILARISTFRGRAPETVEKTPFYGRVGSDPSASNESADEHNITTATHVLRREGKTTIYLT